MRITKEIAELATVARTDEADGYAKFNSFVCAAADLMTADEQREWDNFCMKATQEEIVDEALRILAGTV